MDFLLEFRRRDACRSVCGNRLLKPYMRPVVGPRYKRSDRTVNAGALDGLQGLGDAGSAWGDVRAIVFPSSYDGIAAEQTESEVFQATSAKPSRDRRRMSSGQRAENNGVAIRGLPWPRILTILELEDWSA
jgi:hypothetical protein